MCLDIEPSWFSFSEFSVLSWSNYFNLYLSCIQYIILKTLKNQIFQNNGCNIRHGDPDRYLYAVTTNQKFFKEKPLQRVEPCGPNYISSIVLGDDREEWSNYKRNKGSLPRVETRTYSLLLHRQKSHASSTQKISHLVTDLYQQTLNKLCSQDACIACPKLWRNLLRLS